jgi:hypothetical protein
MTAPRNRVLVIGRSPNVLTETVALLQAKDYAAAATNQFDQVLDEFDVGNYDVVVFGGMVPADTKQRLREEISARNETIVFIQGLAGIPGVIAAQVQESVGDHGNEAVVEYDAASRAVRLSLDQPADVTASAFWATSFVPPEPRSTSRSIFDERLPAGSHIVSLPDDVPTQASFLAVSIGPKIWVFTVGPMPAGLTPALLTDPAPPLSTSESDKGQ